MPSERLATRGALLTTVLREDGVAETVPFGRCVVVALTVSQEM